MTAAASEGQPKHYTFTVSDVPADTFTGSASCGVVPAANYTVTGISGSQTGSFDCTFPDGPVTPDPMVSITFTDDDNGVGSDNKEVAVANVAPMVVLTGPGTANEGQATHYTFTVSDVLADIYGGVADCGVGSVSNYSVTDNHGSQSGSFDCTFPDGPVTPKPMVGITFTDDDNGVGSDNKEVTVANVAPTVVLTGPASANEGETKHYTFTVSDVPADTYGTGVASCGAGSLSNYTVSGSSGNQNGSFDCSFSDNATTTVSVTFTDDDGGVGSDSKTVTVANLAPVVGLSGATSANEGESKHYTFTVSDVPADTYGPGVASCGVGSLSNYAVTGNSGNQSGSFDCSFPDNATTTVSITFTDDDGGVGSDSKTVTVANLAPVVVLSGDTTAYEGQANAKHYTFTVSDVPADTYTGVASCGVGLTSNYTVTGNSGSRSGSFDCTWGDNATTTVSITFTDDDSGVGSDSKTVTVANVAPSKTGHTFTFNPFTGVANASVSFTDPGWLDTVSAIWTGLLPNPSVTFGPLGTPGLLNGTFSAGNTFIGCVAVPINVTVADDEPAPGTGSFSYQFAPANTLGAYTASFMAPIKDGARNIVKLGNVIPVKVQVLDCHGNPVLNRNLTVWLVSGVTAEDIADGTNLTEGTSVSSADNGNQMRIADGHYMFNLATKGLKTGVPFTIIIKDNDPILGTQNIATAAIELKK